MPVSVRQGSNAVAAQFDVAFNAGKASAVTALRGERLTNHVIKSRQVAPGVERVLIYSLGNAAMSASNATVARLPFAMAPGEYVGSGPLTPTNVTLVAANATRLEPVSLNSGTIFVTPANRRPDGIVDFFLPSATDERYLIQATTDFVSWVNLSTNVALGDFLQLVDLDAPNYPHRFYRSAAWDALVGGTLGGVQLLPGGGVTFQVTGFDGRAYTLQASTNLVNWTDFSMVTGNGGRISITNAIAGNQRSRFFRLRSGP